MAMGCLIFHFSINFCVDSEYDSEYSGESGEEAGTASETEDKTSGDDLAYPEEKKYILPLLNHLYIYLCSLVSLRRD